jgi:hypothetical protein
MAGLRSKAMAAFGIVALGGLATAGPASAAEARKSVTFLTFGRGEVTCQFDIWSRRDPGEIGVLRAGTSMVGDDPRCDAQVAVTVRYEDSRGIPREVTAESSPRRVELVLIDVHDEITSTHRVSFLDCENPTGCTTLHELSTK